METIVSSQSKRVSISSKRQLTIPQKFFALLGFNREAECFVRGDELVLRPAPNSGEFAEQILSELISEGFSGAELLAEFRVRRDKIRPAVESLLEEAAAIAESFAGRAAQAAEGVEEAVLGGK